MTPTSAFTRSAAPCILSSGASLAMQRSGVRDIARSSARLHSAPHPHTLRHAPLGQIERDSSRFAVTYGRPQHAYRDETRRGLRHGLETQHLSRQYTSQRLGISSPQLVTRPGLMSGSRQSPGWGILQNTTLDESSPQCGIYNRARRKDLVRMFSTSSVWNKQTSSATKGEAPTSREETSASSHHISSQPSTTTIPSTKPPGTSTFASASTPPTSATSPSTYPAHVTTHSSSVSKVTSAPPPDSSSSTAPFLSHLPDLASPRFHRPTKEELLAAATGFWSRLRVRFKWFSIRSLRPFNSDDISAFFSWILVGHVIWILVGTTTFFSLLILTLNTVFAQETLGRWVGNYLTQSSGVKVVFESAIVPKWRDGVITFKNVFVSRRPGQTQGDVSKGSQTAAAQAAAAALERNPSNTSSINNAPTSVVEPAVTTTKAPEEDTNYTQYDLSIETVNVTLSFAKWLNGKGLLRSVEVHGIRGVVDRTHIAYPKEYIDPRSYKHTHNPGDFELEHFHMEDVLISVYQPHDFRPYSVSIFSADLPCLRKQWLFYDLLSANHMSGSFDGSLFTIHPRQTHNLTGAQLVSHTDGLAPSDALAGGVEAFSGSAWKKHSRIRIDGVRIDHLNRGVEGPFGWIHEGNVDIVADIMFPADADDGIAKVMSDFYDRLEATVSSGTYVAHHHTPLSSTAPPSSQPATDTPTANNDHPHADPNRDRFLIMDLRIHLNAVRAAVPLFASDIGYVNNALIRPIVAYINSHSSSGAGGAYIPVNCRVVKRAQEFDGSWTIYDSGLMEDLSRETYEAFARDIGDETARMRRIRKVGWWGVRLAVQALFLGLAGNLA